MQKFRLERFRDDPNITWVNITRTTYAPFINYCVRQIDSQESYIDDYAMTNVNVTWVPLSMESEEAFRNDAINAFRDLHLESWLSRWNYQIFIPYAPPSFEYYWDDNGKITIDICFYHDTGLYNKISAYNDVDDECRLNLASLYKSHFMNEPDYDILYSEEEDEESE